ncbi:MAG: hypothetical protein AAB527_00820 [Patescibacteria group bacterium]
MYKFAVVATYHERYASDSVEIVLCKTRRQCSNAQTMVNHPISTSIGCDTQYAVVVMKGEKIKCDTSLIRVSNFRENCVKVFDYDEYRKRWLAIEAEKKERKKMSGMPDFWSIL